MLSRNVCLIGMALEVALDRFYLFPDDLCTFKVEVAVMVNHLYESLDLALGFLFGAWLAPFLLRLNLLTTYIVTSQSFLQHLNERKIAGKIDGFFATIELIDGCIQSDERLASARHTSNETDGFALMFSAMVNDLTKFG